MNVGSLYIIKNSINSKVYIGQTTNTIEHRFRKHKSQINSKNVCSALYEAFRKYGKENFWIELLEAGMFSQEELNAKEKYWIDFYESMSPKGYNLQTGGNSFKVSEETKEKMRKKMKGRKVTWGYKVSEGVKRLWEDPEYRERQTMQRHEKRGKYRKGIVRLKKRKKVDLASFERDYRDFMHLDTLSKKYDISVNTIYRIIKRENIKKRGYKCNQEKV